jgi:GNAT superfamily N-acetyltransferase
MKIRPLLSNEIPLLRGFAPLDWNADLSAIFSFHFGHPYFHPIVAELDGIIVGCAIGLLNGNTGWLGNIIVLPQFRGHGIGYALTEHQVDYLHSKGCTTLILTATNLGEPIYRKLGFKTTSQYVFLKTEQACIPAEAPGIRSLDSRDAPSLFTLDRFITGEDRQLFLSRFLSDGWGHEASSGELDGYYLPGLTPGPVLANNDETGLDLILFKIRNGCRNIVAPDLNMAVLQFLRKNGFIETNRAPRMTLGNEVDWHPERVYSRGTGYSG